MSRSLRTIGYLLALSVSFLSLLVFFFLPYFEYTVGTPTVGPWTGQQLASQLNDYQQLWLEPVVAIILIAASSLPLLLARTALQQEGDRIWGSVLLAIGLLTILFLFLQFFIDTQSSYISTTHDFATSHASSIRWGYWLYVACIAVAGVGSLLVIVSSRQAKLAQNATLQS